MFNINFRDKKTQFILIVVAIFAIITLWVRLLPMLMVGNVDILTMVASDDPLYNFRQVEQIIANFPNYAWYDPMSLYPTGTNVYWGPLFTTIIAAVCIIVGATTRPEIIAVGLVIPPIMAMCMVPLMYYMGKICGDWKTGLFASAFIAIVSGQYFFRSLYGYTDHHMAEVLFSSLLCLCYIYTLYSARDNGIKFNDINTYKNIAFLSAITGVAYFIGILAMPTVVLFAMIMFIFTIIQFFIDGLCGITSEYLVVVNGVLFFVVAICLLIFGIKDPGISLSTYSMGTLYLYIGLITGTIIFYLIYKYIGNCYKSMAIVFGIILSGIVVLYFLFPDLFSLFMNTMLTFFGQEPVTNTVQEARAWSFEQAWTAFNYGFILMLGGFIIIIYKNIKNNHSYYTFATIWSLIMLLSAWQHVRYEYYLAVPLVLLSAICISYIIDIGTPDILKFTKKISDGDKDEKIVLDKKKKPKDKRLRKTYKKEHTNLSVLPVVVIAIAVIGCLFAYTSFNTNYAIASSGGLRMNPDWKESMEWMNSNTPDTGVNYTTIYNHDTFKYPNESYGVMSWWDYGHMITYIAKRIPNANPFQEGIVGKGGSATYFMSTSEDKGNEVLDNAGTRYVVTDIEMDTGKFWAMATWNDPVRANSPYQMALFVPSQNNLNNYNSALLNNQEYYMTMVSRLHNFDGSLTIPKTAYYVEYTDADVANTALPIVTNAEMLNASDAIIRADVYNLKAVIGYHATVLSSDVMLPIKKIPALDHYRLVHESPSNVLNSNVFDLKYVKIFEYVKGAHIKGNGTIQVSVVSNTGRNFIYKQESVNGEFIVPYSTIDNSYGVKTTSKYKVIESGKEYDVTENDVMQGLEVK
jgi:dolichyl-phosphooligosaccharide-protein glycotransferase